MKSTTITSPIALASLAVSLLLSGCVSPLGDRNASSISPVESPKSPLANFEDSVVFQPTRFPDGNWTPRGSNWDRGALNFEDAWFHSADGTKLHGWYYPYEQARAVVLFCHGNAGNLSHRADVIRYLHDHHRLSVMIFDYRGYGCSEGTPSEKGVLEDGRAARTWLAQRAGIAEKDIVVMGRSLGGAVAVDLAADGGARGLILESTFTSLPDVAKIKVPFAASMMHNQFDSIGKITAYHGPLLQSHGDVDRVVPYPNGLALFEAANKPKQFVTIPGGMHNTPQSSEYYQALDRFIDG